MNSVLEYNGYQGSVEYSADDNCLVGRVLHIADSLCYDGTTVAEIKAAFEETVDEYIAFCAERGVEASKPFNGIFQVRVSPELHRAAVMAAARKKLKLNDFIKQAIQNASDANASRQVVMTTDDAKVAINEQFKKAVILAQTSWTSSSFGLFDQAHFAPHLMHAIGNVVPLKAGISETSVRKAN